jgi:hypothetical protein
MRVSDKETQAGVPVFPNTQILELLELLSGDRGI